MSIDDKNKKTGRVHHPQTTDDKIDEGVMGDINSSSGEAPENVISDTHSARMDKKHGRHNANPITGANPRGL